MTWPFSTKYTVEDLQQGRKGFAKMTAAPTWKGKQRISGAPATCYELAVFSLVVTGHLKQDVYDAWRGEIPKADTFRVVNPEEDTRITNPNSLPANSIVGFYRRLQEGVESIERTRNQDWVLYHMVRTMAVPNSPFVVGGNNGDRAAEGGGKRTTPTWTRNDVSVMFDWSGKEKVSMYTEERLPEKDSYGHNGKNQFVAFAVSIPAVVARLKRA